MIILDTNVISEPLKAGAHSSVIAWLDRQNPDTLFITTINVYELSFGVELMPAGKKRHLTADTVDQILRAFAGRTLPFDESAATACALLMARARAAGKAIQLADGQIAAIAHLNGFAVATRDVAPFLAAGVTVINPWDTHLQ